MLSPANGEQIHLVNYVEDYLDSIESLPFDLQRNVSLMREIDAKYQGTAGWMGGGGRFIPAGRSAPRGRGPSCSPAGETWARGGGPGPARTKGLERLWFAKVLVREARTQRRKEKREVSMPGCASKALFVVK